MQFFFLLGVFFSLSFLNFLPSDFHTPETTRNTNTPQFPDCSDNHNGSNNNCTPKTTPDTKAALLGLKLKKRYSQTPAPLPPFFSSSITSAAAASATPSH